MPCLAVAGLRETVIVAYRPFHDASREKFKTAMISFLLAGRRLPKTGERDRGLLGKMGGGLDEEAMNKGGNG